MTKRLTFDQILSSGEIDFLLNNNRFYNEKGNGMQDEKECELQINPRFVNMIRTNLSYYFPDSRLDTRENCIGAIIDASIYLALNNKEENHE